MRAIPLRLWLLAFASGVLQVLAFPLAGPVPSWRRALCWCCLSPLLLALSDIAVTKPKRPIIAAAALGYGCGFTWYLGNCYWIEPTMHLYGGMPSVAACGVLILFALYLGLYHALFGTVFTFTAPSANRRAAIALTPVLWVAVEMARTRITGFPWDLLGYTQGDNFLLARLAPVTGVMGLSFVIAATNALFAWACARQIRLKERLLRFSFPVAIIVVCQLGSMLAVPQPATADRSAVLVQDNLSIGGSGGEEPENDLLADLARISIRPTQQSTRITPSVILWPEAPTDFFDTNTAFRGRLSMLATATGAAVIAEDVAPAPTGADGSRHLYNSARLTQPDDSEGGRYDKMHLVPFGEYVPFKPLFFFIGKVVDDLPFSPGLTRRQLVSGGHRYGVFICYESIFGDEVRQFTRDGAQVLVNLSDDGWYGDTSAPWEHLDMARMRARENDRWLLRATNTGITGVIDPNGRIIAQLPRHVRASLQAPFSFRDDLTVYARFGDWFGWLCVSATIASMLVGLVRRKRYTEEAASDDEVETK